MTFDIEMNATFNALTERKSLAAFRREAKKSGWISYREERIGDLVYITVRKRIVEDYVNTFSFTASLDITKEELGL